MAIKIQESVTLVIEYYHHISGVYLDGTRDDTQELIDHCITMGVINIGIQWID